MRWVLVLAAVILLTGCGQTSDPSKQAEQLRSFAAEGALLAHDAADGSSFGPFTRVHSRVLREDVETLEPHLERRELVRLADEIAAALEQLPDRPEAAARQLDDAADRAGELAR